MEIADNDLMRIGKSTLWTLIQETPFYYVASMAIDADGAPTAYHPEGKGIDHLGNAGKPGNWWALVTDSGEPSGNPVVQGDGDPAPGYYISATALADRTIAKRNPRRYVDSSTIPYFVLPPEAAKARGVRGGDLGVVLHRPSGKLCAAIFADVGPRGKIGEGSIALAEALGLKGNPKNGGTSKRELGYLIFPGSGDRAPKPKEEIARRGEELFQQWGGLARFQEALLLEDAMTPFGPGEDLDDPRPIGLERSFADVADLF